jgi:hypothetical protein
MKIRKTPLRANDYQSHPGLDPGSRKLRKKLFVKL